MNNYKSAAGKLASIGIIATVFATACSMDEKNEADGYTGPIDPIGEGGAGAGNDDDGTQTTGEENQQVAAANVSVTIGSGTSGTTTGGGNDGAAGAGPGPGSNTLPPGFTAAELGGFKVYESNDEDAIDSDDCGSTILGVVRDFRRGDQDGGHADFEIGHYIIGAAPHIVADDLGSERKPVFLNAGASDLVSDQTNFDEWYRNTDGINDPFVVAFWFEPQNGVLTFASTVFFPLDGFGYGDQGLEHNYHFTTEIHTEFSYKGGETFTFQGDDDLWVFINGQLALDMGGVHPQLNTTIDIDAEAARLGIEVGNVYPLDFFHAERQTAASNFRVETNLEFTNCGEIIDPIIK